MFFGADVLFRPCNQLRFRKQRRTGDRRIDNLFHDGHADGADRVFRVVGSLSEGYAAGQKDEG